MNDNIFQILFRQIKTLADTNLQIANTPIT